MRYARRLIYSIVGCAAWCMAAATAAYAQLPADPSGSNSGVVPADPAMSAWEFVAFAALGVLMIVAVLGLVFSLRNSRMSEPRLHA